MRTTVVIDDELFRRAKQVAADQRLTFGELVSVALRDTLTAEQQEPPQRNARQAPFVMVVFGRPGRKAAREPADFAATLADELVTHGR